MSNRRVGSSPVSRTRIRSPMGRPLYARVVELADSLDSGSSVLYGRAGSSPASRTKKKDGSRLIRGGSRRLFLRKATSSYDAREWWNWQTR